MNNEITTFAKTNFRGQERVFGIKHDDRRRHFYVIGKTGSGKTTMIQNMAVQDIQAGRGVAIVDPHGEFAETALKAIPSHRINDVVYFNPADQDNPIALNVMEKVEPEYRHLIASGLVGVFKKIWADSWGPRLEYLLRNAILALLEYPGSTLLGVTRILVDKQYRARVIEKLTDPVVRSFWVDEFTKYHDRLMVEAIAPIQNKVGQFLSSSLIRNIVGQTKSAFNVREIMDNKKILIMNLSKGRIGEDNSALLGAMMITKIQLAAMARIDMPEEKREDFYLYVDEFQNFATESFANILSEARKYRLNLILAHQYIEQLDEKVRAAVFGNVGTIILFRVGAGDAEFLEKEFEPVFMAQDLVNLPNYNIYVKLMIDGIAGSAFSAATLPMFDLSKTAENAEKLVKVTRERYGTSREIVEDKIARWSGMVPERDLADQEGRGESRTRIDRRNLGRKSVKKEDTGRKRRPVRPEDTIRIKSSGDNQELAVAGGGRQMYAAKCHNCEIDIEVPFKPDGSRPTFCKDCLKDFQRQQARIQQTQAKKREMPQGTASSPRENNRPPRTISLRDAARIPPKPFRREREERPRKKVNLAEVRSLIRESLESRS